MGAGLPVCAFVLVILTFDRVKNMLILLIILILCGGFGGGYWGHSQWGANYPYAGPGFGLGTILIILLIAFLLGGFR
jgi:hypothetical protein